MYFASDNSVGVHPEIIDALRDAAPGYAGSYGGDDETAKVEKKLADLFEREVSVFLMSTGTAANALAIASVTPPWGGVFCHRDSHIMTDECGACEFYTGGAKLITLPGDGAKISAAALEHALTTHPSHRPHSVPPTTLSITQATENGRIYTIDEVAALTEIAQGWNMAVHMDGARFANALVTLGCTPAEITWKAGVDLLSFGATKNGCLAAEAIIVFDKANAEEMSFRRMRAGHLLSKSRFLAAQIDAYLTNDLWLRSATHANAMGRRLGAGIVEGGHGRLAWPVEANEVFAIMPRALADAVREAGAVFYDWPGAGPVDNGASDDEVFVRLVASFATTESDVDQLLGLLATRGHSEAAE